MASFFQPKVQVGGQLGDVHLGLLEPPGVVPVHGLPADESGEGLLKYDKYCTPPYAIHSLASLLFVRKSRKNYQNMVEKWPAVQRRSSCRLMGMVNYWCREWAWADGVLPLAPAAAVSMACGTR
jgi:hypothetical protein